ncbi:MAG TPA: hypothetical protein VJX67_08895 [Blastocatellia bacterium]|nr:hypothetical protein [Blastocatellia bacterium]
MKKAILSGIFALALALTASSAFAGVQNKKAPKTKSTAMASNSSGKMTGSTTHKRHHRRRHHKTGGSSATSNAAPKTKTPKTKSKNSKM